MGPSFRNGNFDRSNSGFTCKLVLYDVFCHSPSEHEFSGCTEYSARLWLPQMLDFPTSMFLAVCIVCLAGVVSLDFLVFSTGILCLIRFTSLHHSHHHSHFLRTSRNHLREVEGLVVSRPLPLTLLLYAILLERPMFAVRGAPVQLFCYCGAVKHTPTCIRLD